MLLLKRFAYYAGSDDKMKNNRRLFRKLNKYIIKK